MIRSCAVRGDLLRGGFCGEVRHGRKRSGCSGSSAVQVNLASKHDSGCAIARVSQRRLHGVLAIAAVHTDDCSVDAAGRAVLLGTWTCRRAQPEAHHGWTALAGGLRKRRLHFEIRRAYSATRFAERARTTRCAWMASTRRLRMNLSRGLNFPATQAENWIAGEKLLLLCGQSQRICTPGGSGCGISACAEDRGRPLAGTRCGNSMYGGGALPRRDGAEPRRHTSMKQPDELEDAGIRRTRRFELPARQEWKYQKAASSPANWCSVLSRPEQKRPWQQPSQQPLLFLMALF